jgi:hypothetical protein
VVYWRNGRAALSKSVSYSRFESGCEDHGESTSRVLAAVATRMEATALAVGMSALRHVWEVNLSGDRPCLENRWVRKDYASCALLPAILDVAAQW